MTSPQTSNKRARRRIVSKETIGSDTDREADNDTAKATPNKTGSGSRILDMLELDEAELAEIDDDPTAGDEKADAEMGGSEPEGREVTPERQLLKTSAKAKPTKAKPSQVLSDDEYIPRNITYEFSILTAKEAKKKQKDRQIITVLYDLKEDLVWDTVKAKMLARISEYIRLRSINFGDFKFTFTIPRHAPTPIMLNSDVLYESMKKRALMTKGEAIVKILAEQLNKPKPQSKKDKQQAKAKDTVEDASDDEGSSDDDDDTDEDEDEPPKKKKKSQIPRLNNVPNHTKAIAEKVLELEKRWECNTPKCPSTTCYVAPDSANCVPLGNKELNEWAAAWLKDDATASCEKPPAGATWVRQLRLPSGAVGALTLLDQRRLAKEQEKGARDGPSVATAAPNIQLHFGNDIMNLVRGGNVPSIAEAPAPAPAAPAPAPNAAPPTTMLLNQLAYAPGLTLTSEEFCKAYEVADEIQELLLKAGYRRSNTFKYIELASLKDSGWLPGQIAEMQEAVTAWAQPIPK